MRIISALILIVSAMAIGCGRTSVQIATQPIVVKVSIHNSLTNDVDWVQLVWPGPDVPVGVLQAGGFATTYGVEWPTVPNAQLTFVDKLTRKPFNISISLLETNQRLRSGKYHHVTMSIVGYDKAEVTCE